MTTLVLEESQLLNQHEQITDLPHFLKNHPRKEEITLVLKTHNVSYHLCPIRKALPHLKSNEFSSEHWIGEKVLSKGQILVAGILPSDFMRQTIQIMAAHTVPIRGIFLWADLVTEAFGALPEGWELVLHENHLMVCQDGVLRLSRLCYLSLAQELPALLRYLKRFGLSETTTLTVLSSENLGDSFPPMITVKTCNPAPFAFRGLKVYIPTLVPLLRLARWPRRIRWGILSVTFIALLTNAYLGWQVYLLFKEEAFLSQRVQQLSAYPPVDESKMEAFATFQQTPRVYPTLLSHVRLLNPLLQGEAVVTHLHWVAHPFHLILHLDLLEDTSAEHLFSTIQAHFPSFKVSWRPEENAPLKGVLTFDEKNS